MPAPIGNQNAVKGKIVGDALRKVAVQNPERLAAMSLKMIEQAQAGDIQAAAWVRDTLDGRPHQSSDITVSGTLQDTLTSIQAVEVPE